MDKIFKFFDIYGTSFNLRINGDGKFKSVFGGLLSIITMAILVWTIINFGMELYLRQIPGIMIEDGIYSNEDIPLLKGTDYNEKFIVLQYEKDFDKIIKPMTYKLGENQSVNIVYFQDCPLDYLHNKTILASDMDFLLNTYTFKCIKLNDFDIGGQGYAAGSFPLIIQWQDCRDIDDNVILQNNLTTCDNNYDYNITQNFMRFTAWYEKVGFIPGSVNPFITKVASSFNIFTRDKNNFVYFPLSIYNLKDDLGWITEDYHTSMYFNILPTSSVPYPELIQDLIYPRAYLIFYVTDDYKMFTRTYTKIQDVLAEIGGFMKLVFYLLNLFNALIRAYLIDNYLINKIFDNDPAKNYKFNSNRSNSVFVSPISSKKNYLFIIETRKTIYNNTIRRDEVENNSSNILILDNNKNKNICMDKNIEKEKDKDNELNDISINYYFTITIDSAISKIPPEANNILKKHTRRPLLNFCSYFKAVIYNLFNRKFDIKTIKGKNLEIIRKKILVSDKVTDFSYILDKMTNVDILKNIILNENQMLSLEFMQKPREVDITDAQNNFKFDNTEENNKNLVKLYFSKLVSEDNLIGYDEILFRKLDDDIKEDIIINSPNNMLKG